MSATETGLQLAATAPADIEVTAENADEIAQAQDALIAWVKRKIEEVAAQARELQESFEHAVKCKWKSDVLKRHAAIALKRVDFYQRMLTALEHGYQIVPTFPITAFAVRTHRKKPLKMLSTSNWSTREQPCAQLPAGEGEYQNPFPVQYERSIGVGPGVEKPYKEFWAERWADLEFPMTMAKPRIMEATNRAMALRIFDDIGILPEKPRQDPVIVARLKDPRSTKYNQRWVTFIVAWHLDTRTL